MSIHYDLYDTPDIQKKGEEQPLHPRVVFNGTIDQEKNKNVANIVYYLKSPFPFLIN